MREFQSYENYFVYFQMRLSLLANALCSRMSYFTTFCANMYLIGAKAQDCYQRLLGNGTLEKFWLFFVDWVGMVYNFFLCLFSLADVLLSP